MNFIYFVILVIFLFYLLNLYENFESCKLISCSSGYTLSNNTCEIVNNVTCPSGQYLSSDNITCNKICDTGFIYNFKTKICDKNISCPSSQTNQLVNIANTCYKYTDEYNFTNCDASGRFGPTLIQCNNFYKTGNALNGKITIDADKQGIQKWTVPKEGRYLITVAGAGIKINDTKLNKYSKGAIISSIFTLYKGDILKILVGQQGTQAFNKITTPNAYWFWNYSGCGGSFVVKFDDTKTSDKDKNIPLIIAGGAGGLADIQNMNQYIDIQFEKSNASFDSTGKSGFNDIEIYGGGKNGNGGSYSTSYVQTNIISSSEIGNSGGGFYTDGKSIYYDGNTYMYDNIYYSGLSFLNGGGGGIISSKDIGVGFGGFGGGGISLYNISGSGGGYSGGGFTKYIIGNGGGSYSSEKMNVLGYNDGMGYVNIKYLGV